MTTPTTAVQVETHGHVPRSDSDYARTRAGEVLRYTRDPVPYVRIRLTHLADPALERPAVVQANLDLDGRPLRAHAARPTMREAIDEVHDRLRDRIERAARGWEAVRGRRPGQDPHGWRHECVPAERAARFPRPPEEREVVRHKAFSLPRLTVDEAAFDMEMLDYGFHLFVEDGSGTDSVLYRTDEGGYRLAQVCPRPDAVAAGAVPATVSPHPAPQTGVAEAADRLEVTGWPFVFFADPDSGRGCVLYHRYDGHYGLITPAT